MLELSFYCLTIDQLYLYIIHLFQKLVSEYSASEQHINNFFLYIEEVIITFFRSVIKKIFPL